MTQSRLVRQAICTKFLGPTNHRGSRVKAYAQAGSVTVSWDSALDVNENHEKAALVFARKMGWLSCCSQDKTLETFELIGGALPDGRGNCYVIVAKQCQLHSDCIDFPPLGEACVSN